MRRKLLAALLLALAMAGGAPAAARREGGAASPVRLAADGWFRLNNGKLFVPLGGFHGNMIPVAMVRPDAKELRRLSPYLWDAQTTDGLGHIDLFDASDEILRRWFRMLAGEGVTAVRLFPRARVGPNVLDLCGRPNLALEAAFERAFRAARPYGIRFLLQIIPEPNLSCYSNDDSVKNYVLPGLSPEEMGRLTPSQKRFIVERRHVGLRDWFTDPDVLSCQKLYLERVLEWVARQPQIFALELYNEQGWSESDFGDKRLTVFGYPWEEAEIRWTGEIARFIKQRLPGMPVTVSHAGFGVVGFDPFRWAAESPMDFYSPHMYAGLCGESVELDFGAVSGATAAVIGAGLVNFNGEWGVLNSLATQDVRRLAHRDALWLSLMAHSPGFMQWTYEFPDEYRRPAAIIAALPKDFSPERPKLAVDIGEAYRRFHDNTRYPLFSPDKVFPAFPFIRQKQADANLQRIFAAYRRSLDMGVPIRFTMSRADGSLSVEEFAALDAAAISRPIRASGGYQLAYLADPRSRTWLAYLRSRKVQAFGRQFLGVRVEKPLRIDLDLPPGRYHAYLIDLDSGGVRASKPAARGSIDVAGRTAHDYVLMITARRARVRRMYTRNARVFRLEVRVCGQDIFC